jgi:hypothetical protein
VEAKQQLGGKSCFLLVSRLAYSSTMKIDAAESSEILMDFYQITQHDIS